MPDERDRLWNLERLFEAFPPPSWEFDPDRLLDSYLCAIEDFDDNDVTAAVTRLLKAEASLQDHRYRPTPPMVAAACRALRNARLERQTRLDGARPTVLSPDVVKTPESKRRVLEIVEKISRGSAGRRVRTSDWEDRTSSSQVVRGNPQVDGCTSSKLRSAS